MVCPIGGERVGHEYQLDLTLSNTGKLAKNCTTMLNPMGMHNTTWGKPLTGALTGNFKWTYTKLIQHRIQKRKRMLQDSAMFTTK